MGKTCGHCGAGFTVEDRDLKYYDRISPIFGGKKFAMPEPSLCPDCRERRRLSFRNERNFYHRKCDFTGQNIISVYSADKPVKVYSYDSWWGDDWDPLKYGRDFDFERPFFEQYRMLAQETPRLYILNMTSENSIYTNHSAGNKNCYMTINTGWCEDLHYCSNYNLNSKDCVDCVAVKRCERCYYCTNLWDCQFCTYLYECKNMTDSHFCYDCHSCQNCFGCYNLRQKKYCIFNEQYSQEEYGAKLSQLMPRTWKEYRAAFEDFKRRMREDAIHKAVYVENCQNVTGDHIWNSKNVSDSYYAFECEDCRYCYDVGLLKDSYDSLEPYGGELQYESHGCNDGYNIKFLYKCYGCKDSIYCQYCWDSSNLFGCFGLRRKQYCVFNKQYSKEEYEKVVARILEHMQHTGEWGELFPIADSPFAYNETTANDYYPMTRDEVLAQGWKWKDDLEKKVSDGGFEPPDKIEDVGDDICEKVLSCEVSGRPFKIVPQELKFYRRMKLPVPRMHFDERFKERLALRNPRRLWSRQCASCKVGLMSTFAPEREEKIYCEKCYESVIY